MDGIIVKTAPLDTLTIFRDNGNGNMDSTKVMVKMLEEKVNKKIEIIENKNKGENIDNNKFNDKIKELEDNLNQINGELNKIKNGNKNKEEKEDKNKEEKEDKNKEEKDDKNKEEKEDKNEEEEEDKSKKEDEKSKEEEEEDDKNKEEENGKNKEEDDKNIKKI